MSTPELPKAPVPPSMQIGSRSTHHRRRRALVVRPGTARSVVALVVLLLLAATPAPADRVDDYLRREMARRHVPGLSLAVVRDGKVIKAKGYGFANLELRARAT